MCHIILLHKNNNVTIQKVQQNDYCKRISISKSRLIRGQICWFLSWIFSKFITKIKKKEKHCMTPLPDVFLIACVECTFIISLIYLAQIFHLCTLTYFIKQIACRCSVMISVSGLQSSHIMKKISCYANWILNEHEKNI